MIRVSGCDFYTDCCYIITDSFRGMFMRTDVGGYYIDPYIGCLQIRACIAVFPLSRMVFICMVYDIV